jgi:flagellar hook-associated protein 3 FlgL
MLPSAIQSSLNDLNQMQSQMDTLERQISSGIAVQLPSDDPSAVGSIYQTQTRIAELQQSQSDLGQVQAEQNAGDAALQQAIQVVTAAISVATQASDPGVDSTSPSLSALADEVQGYQQTLVNLANTTVGESYIFGGDYNQQAPYELNSSQPEGVQELTPASSTRVVTDANGSQVWLSKTAQEIFDLQNANGTAASGNVFAAINSLLTSLQNGDASAATATLPALQAASEHLNQELGYYGIGEDQVANAVQAQSSYLVTEQTNLSNLRDTNMASAATQMTQLQTQQQASLESLAKFQQLDLFQFLA